MKAVGQDFIPEAREAAWREAQRPLDHHQKEPGWPFSAPAQRHRG